MKKSTLIELLRNAQYRPSTGGEALCRGSIYLNSGCGRCPRCLWEKKRRDALNNA